MQGLRQTDCILHQVLPYQNCNGNLKKVIQDCRTSLLGLFSSHSFGNYFLWWKLQWSVWLLGDIEGLKHYGSVCKD